MKENQATIAELLKPLGYTSGQFGKNHLGDQMWTFVPAQTIAAEFLATFQEFPPVSGSSLGIDKVVQSLTAHPGAQSYREQSNRIIFNWLHQMDFIGCSFFIDQIKELGDRINQSISPNLQ